MIIWESNDFNIRGKDENIIEDVFALLSEKIQNVQVCPDITFATLFFLANHPGWVFSRAQKKQKDKRPWMRKAA